MFVYVEIGVVTRIHKQTHAAYIVTKIFTHILIKSNNTTPHKMGVPNRTLF